MRFMVLVEGHMERMAVHGFLKKWLDARLDPPIGVRVRMFQGKDHYRRECPKVARTYLEGPDSGDIIGVIGLLDLCGPTWFPERITDCSGRRAWATEEFERAVDDERFRQFFAMHDVESWLLSDPSLFSGPMRTTITKIKEPEKVNFTRPPSKVLAELFSHHRPYGYGKTTDGRDLLSRLDPDVAAKKCPALRELLDTMVDMATERGCRRRAG